MINNVTTQGTVIVTKRRKVTFASDEKSVNRTLKNGTLSLNISKPIAEQPLIVSKPAVSRYDQQRLEHLMILATAFPGVISMSHPRPLSLAICDELSDWCNATGQPFEPLRVALGLYCNRTQYFRSFKHAVHRINLKGEEVEMITPIHRKYAQKKLWAISRKKQKPSKS